MAIQRLVLVGVDQPLVDHDWPWPAVGRPNPTMVNRKPALTNLGPPLAGLGGPRPSTWWAKASHGQPDGHHGLAWLVLASLGGAIVGHGLLVGVPRSTAWPWH